MKYCRRCYKYQDITNFHRSKSRSYPDGHIAVCKGCIKIYNSHKNEVVEIKCPTEFVILFN